MVLPHLLLCNLEALRYEVERLELGYRVRLQAGHIWVKLLFLRLVGHCILGGLK